MKGRNYLLWLCSNGDICSQSRTWVQVDPETCAEKWPEKEIYIEAQEQVVGLYEKFGFEGISEPFILESRVHVKMVYKRK